MRKITDVEKKEIEFSISELLQSAVSSEYSKYILEQKDNITGNTFMEDVIQNVLETSAWEDEGYYNEDDIRLAIGREFIARLGIEF